MLHRAHNAPVVKYVRPPIRWGATLNAELHSLLGLIE